MKVTSCVPVVALCCVLALTLSLFATSSLYAQSPSNGWNYFGAVKGVYTATDRVVYNIEDPYTGHTSRLECFYLERGGCDDIALNHWVVMEGYTKGVSAGCWDGANNELHVVRMQVWNLTTGQWEVVAP